MFSDLELPSKMVQEKMSLHSSSLESVRLSFYCNSHTAILNPHHPQAKQSFAESFSGAFFQKGAVLRRLLNTFKARVVRAEGSAVIVEGADFVIIVVVEETIGGIVVQ